MNQRATDPEDRRDWSASDARRGLIDAAVGVAVTRRAALAAVAAAFSGAAGAAAVPPAAAKKGRRRSRTKVPVCHNGKTQEVSIRVAKARLARGDTLGPCGSVVAEPPPPRGGCTPLLQVCWPEWLGGNRCCDAQAECTYVNADVPAFLCLDSNRSGCTSDAECRKRFTDPNIACLPHFPATCPHGVHQCCQRKLCPNGLECGEGVVCCNSPASLFQNVCCSANETQICGAAGCATP